MGVGVVVVAADTWCPECGEDELQEVAGYPEDRTGRIRVYLVCPSCGYDEEIGVDGVL